MGVANALLHLFTDFEQTESIMQSDAFVLHLRKNKIQCSYRVSVSKDENKVIISPV